MRFTQRIKVDREVGLDLKDKKILYWLSENSRMPYTKIAKKVQLSKDTINYRIKKLENGGVIQGYLPVVDVSKLGYYTCHIFLQLNKLNETIKKKLISILKPYPFVKVVIEFSGRYNFEVGIVAKDIKELDTMITKIVNSVSQFLQEYQILILSDYYEGRVFPKNFLNLEEKKVQKTNFKLKIDEIDLEILKILSTNAITPLYKIGEMTKLSADTVNYRIKKMLKRGFITKFIPVINYSILGYTVYAVLINIHNLTTEKEKTLKYFLKNNENILWAVKTIGKYNLLMYVCTKKSDELHQTLIRLRELFSSDIKDYETLIAYEEYKYTYFPEICVKAI